MYLWESCCRFIYKPGAFEKVVLPLFDSNCSLFDLAAKGKTTDVIFTPFGTLSESRSLGSSFSPNLIECLSRPVKAGKAEKASRGSHYHEFGVVSRSTTTLYDSPHYSPPLSLPLPSTITWYPLFFALLSLSSSQSSVKGRLVSISFYLLHAHFCSCATQSISFSLSLPIPLPPSIAQSLTTCFIIFNHVYEKEHWWRRGSSRLQR